MSSDMKKMLWTALLIWIVFFLLPIYTVFAQDDHKWIQENPWYKDTQGHHCCGIAHCRPLPHGFVREVRSGWFVPSTGQSFPDTQLGKGLFWSKDWQYHGCLGKRADGTEYVICLFVPASGA